MEFRGTKGKWKAVNCGKDWNNTAIDNIEIQYGNDGECVSDYVYCEYDALLISKAPEMLEMLIDAVSEYKSGAVVSDGWYKAVEQLIKQATEL